MKIYRVEHPKTEMGPYQSDGEKGLDLYEKLGDMYSEHCNRINYPTRFNDCCGGFDNQIFMACPCKETLMYWFGKYIDKLKELGFIFYEIRIRKNYVIMGNSGKQVGFDKNKVLNKIPISI